MLLKRMPSVCKFTFSGTTAGVTEGGSARRPGDPFDCEDMSFGGLHVEAGLNGRTINFIDNGPWGAQVVLQKAVATGFNPLTSDEILRLSPSLKLTATLDTGATGSFWLKMKS